MTWKERALRPLFSFMPPRDLLPAMEDAMGFDEITRRVAAAEAAVALALAMSVYRNRETVDVDRINLMKS